MHIFVDTPNIPGHIFNYIIKLNVSKFFFADLARLGIFCAVQIGLELAESSLL